MFTVRSWGGGAGFEQQKQSDCRTNGLYPESSLTDALFWIVKLLPISAPYLFTSIPPEGCFQQGRDGEISRVVLGFFVPLPGPRYYQCDRWESPSDAAGGYLVN